MASPCRIITDTVALAAAGRQLVEALERRWSRFIDCSDVSALNRSAGSVCIVSAETYRLVELAQAARVATDGSFNPLVLNRLERLGYSTKGAADTSGEHLDAQPITSEPIALFPDVSAIRLPPSSRFDPGGIGKGLAGDFVADHLVALGAETAQVELGGDVRLVGDHWTNDEWKVDVRDPHQRDRIMARLSVPEGAIATSSVLGRTWRQGDRSAHHLIDTATGLPSDTDIVAVTAVADRLWWAEIVAKVALMAGAQNAESVMTGHGVSGVILHRTGDTTVVNSALSVT